MSGPSEFPTLPPRKPETDPTSGTDQRTLPPIAPNTDAVNVADQVTLPMDNQTSEAPPVDAQVFGDYELISEIARGGMGVVFKAKQRNLNRTVALKMILAGQLAGADDVQRFHAEAEAAANLDHPGIVPIFEVGQHDGQHYFSMGFVDGESLADRLKDGPLPPREAAELTKKVAEAVAYAHEHGVIHRDLKPANVLLASIGRQPDDSNDPSGDLRPPLAEMTPKITDFGLAKKVESDSHLTASGQILGTPSFMPPEQAAGRIDEVTETADIYSLGAILYNLITGRPPFQADNHLDTLLQVMEKEPVSPRQLNPRLPQDLETVCLKCLEKDRQRRYATAHAVVDELERFLNDEPIVATPISQLAKAWRWCRRKPILAGMWASIAVLVLTLSIGGPLAAIRQAALHRAAEQAQRERATAQINGLLSASPAAVPVIVESLRPAYDEFVPELLELLNSRKLSESERVRVSLALLDADSDQVSFLSRRMLVSEPEEFLVIRKALEPHSQGLTPGLWQCALDDGRDAAHRLRAVCALALYDKDNLQWGRISEEVAEFLVSQNSLTVGPWMDALRPVRGYLVEPLSEIYLERSEEQAARRILATNILAEYAADQSETLVRLLVEADAQQFAELFPIVSQHREEVIPQLEAMIDSKLGTAKTGGMSRGVASRCANAAVALLRLDGWKAVRPLLGRGAEPHLRSYLIHRFRSHGAPVDVFTSQVEKEADPFVRPALLLSLGQFPRSAVVATELTALKSQLLQIYCDDPGSGVHGASDWLLRVWGYADELAPIDQQLAEANEKSDRRWFVNRQGQTFAVLEPGEFQMGSPERETGRRADEQLHTRQIGHPFAIAVKEVTVAQFQRFLAEQPEVRHTYSQQHSPAPQCPQTSVTWYEAAAYCNWLSEQEGFPGSQWCFVPTEGGQYASGMLVADGYLHLTGYRLPTEAEWEYACRGDTTTIRSYGDSEDLLNHYAWYLSNALDRSWPVGEKKPNNFGLFDMHGNVWEWCAETPRDYPSDQSTVVRDDVPDMGPIHDGQPRALRGGSYFYHHIYTRSALRNKEPADARYYGIGLRPVRTVADRADTTDALPGRVGRDEVGP